MEKRNLIFGVILVIFISGCINQSELPNANEIENNPCNIIFPLRDNYLCLALSGERYIPEGMTNEQETRAKLQNKHFAKENISLDLRFINMGYTEEIKILNVFEPIPVFFSIYIEREDGTPILVPSVGAISFMEGSLDYIILENRGDQYHVTLNLNEILPEGLEVGTYTVSVEYHNQYGEGFKGSLKSNPITLEVMEKTKEEVLFEEEYGKYINNSKYCEKDADCVCVAGSGVPFIGCWNFLYGYGVQGQECAFTPIRCECARGICQETS